MSTSSPPPSQSSASVSTSPAPSGEPLAPGSRIGILGGGQLGRMAALAAARLGYDVHIYCPESDSPASRVAAAVTVAPYDDGAALEAFAASVDVVTYEFENIPNETLCRLATRIPVRPSAEALEISQDRLLEKRFLRRRAQVATVDYRPVTSFESLSAAVVRLGWPAVLKTTRMGYDGKGQILIEPDTDLRSAWTTLGGKTGGTPCILEAFLDFTQEVAVIVARGPDGHMVAYPPVQTLHVHHILDTVIAPAELPETCLSDAQGLAKKVAETLDIVGLLAIEMFVDHDGRFIVNEIAPRPHNSGHWTQDGCRTDQFEQLIRAICGLPLGPVDLLAPRTVMTNLLGPAARDWQRWLADPHAKLHLYGKRDWRPGRKMGHVNRMETGRMETGRMETGRMETGRMETGHPGP